MMIMMMVMKIIIKLTGDSDVMIHKGRSPYSGPPRRGQRGHFAVGSDFYMGFSNRKKRKN